MINPARAIESERCERRASTDLEPGHTDIGRAIRDEHTLDIFHHIPNSQLAILPNATHMVPFDQAASFNAVLERFFRTPFVKKDRIGDTMKS
jgi:hypothetical protein